MIGIDYTTNVCSLTMGDKMACQQYPGKKYWSFQFRMIGYNVLVK
jgi:hypothetical protein